MFAEIVRKYLALWVAIVVCLALVIGYHFPSVNFLKKFIPFLLFFMLLPMMITLRIENIANALKNLKLSVISILVNFLIAPLLGALWAHLLFRDTDPFLAAGFILKVTVPCAIRCSGPLWETHVVMQVVRHYFSQGRQLPLLLADGSWG